jgi:molecular chaperone GrpE
VTGISREEILRRFETWLDRALAAEEPPRGVDAEILEAMTADDQDSEAGAEYSLWSAMTALTQEVKLQGRSFKELSAAVAAQSNAASGPKGEPDRERELVRETERRCRKEVLGVLIDLRDRLKRGLESVQASEGQLPQAVLSPPPQGFLAHLFSPAPQVVVPDTRLDTILPALKKGYEMGLERVDQTLEEFNAREIPCQGRPFDARKMNAIDRLESSTVPEGTVIEVYRSGYEWNGEVFRPAQVKVACAPLDKKR